MQRQELKSSTLLSAGYDEDTHTLEVLFSHGTSVYQYADVPPCVFENLFKAESAGKYFGANIRGVYNFTKLLAIPCAGCGLPSGCHGDPTLNTIYRCTNCGFD